MLQRPPLNIQVVCPSSFSLFSDIYLYLPSAGHDVFLDLLHFTIAAAAGENGNRLTACNEAATTGSRKNLIEQQLTFWKAKNSSPFLLGAFSFSGCCFGVKRFYTFFFFILSSSFFAGAAQARAWAAAAAAFWVQWPNERNELLLFYALLCCGFGFERGWVGCR